MKIRDVVEGYTVLPPIDREKYQARDGLEGPFRLKNNKVVYYDPQEGKYYDPDTDMYIDYDDYRKMDEEADSKTNPKLEAGLNSFSSKEAAMKHAKKMEDKGYLTRYSMGSTDYRSSQRYYPHQITHYFRDNDHKNEYRRQKYAEKKLAKEDADVGSQIADLIRKKNSASSPIARKNIDSQIAQLKKQRDKTKDVNEMDKRPGYVVKASDKPKKIKPSMGGESPHPYQGKIVGATEAEVSNTDYEWTHGKKPKGTGSWFFVAHKGGVNFGKDVEGEDYIELHGMSYGDAKRAAIKWAKSKGHTSLYVGT